jgi:hypothetical protein
MHSAAPAHHFGDVLRNVGAVAAPERPHGALRRHLGQTLSQNGTCLSQNNNSTCDGACASDMPAAGGIHACDWLSRLRAGERPTCRMLSTPEPRCTCCSMRSRSIGAVAVRLRAPARPPAEQLVTYQGRELMIQCAVSLPAPQRPLELTSSVQTRGKSAASLKYQLIA